MLETIKVCVVCGVHLEERVAPLHFKKVGKRLNLALENQFLGIWVVSLLEESVVHSHLGKNSV